MWTSWIMESIGEEEHGPQNGSMWRGS